MTSDDSSPGRRIAALDGLRGVAVAAVIGFHYFSRWTPPRNPSNLYPYGPVFSDLPVFSTGHLGVHLFFLVSGFVISMTLARCQSAGDFLLRRFARLFPAMLLGSALTFLVLRTTTPHFWSPGVKDFIPSLLFTDPVLIQQVTGFQSSFIDSAYWSLFVEVRFYAWTALLYYGISRSGYLLLSAWAMNLSIAAFVIEHMVVRNLGPVLFDWLLFPTFAPWLYSGVACYFIWLRRANLLAWGIFLEGLAVNLYLCRVSADRSEWWAVLACYALLGAFALRSRAVRLLEVRWLTKIGAASYLLYLIHQRIGVTAIHALSKLFGLSGGQSIVLPFLVAGLLATISVFLYEYYEVPARRWITEFGRQRLPDRPA